jgi:putative DNA methylase
MTIRKKLIEVALPLEAINTACKVDKDRKTGHIRNIHKWFAPMPLPALRALIAATLLDAPDDRESLSERLDLIANLVASGPEAPPSEVLRTARRLLGAEGGATEAWILDPFCGGGSTLVEAQRLGLNCEGSDLNPLPVLISRALTVAPAKYCGRQAITSPSLTATEGLSGFQTDIRNYANRIREFALRQLSDIYPKAPNGDPIIYWWWAHTVPSPDPAFAHCETPLVMSWWLSLRSGDEQFLVPHPDRVSGEVKFTIERDGSPQTTDKNKCIFSNAPITYPYVREQAGKGKLGRMLMAMVSDGDHGRCHWVPDAIHRKAAQISRPEGLPSLEIPSDGLGISIRNYNVTEWSELFTPRQQRELATFAEAVSKVPDWVREDGGTEEYARDIASFLGLCLGKLAQASSTIVRLNVRRGPAAKAEPAFARGDIQLNWDFAETNPFGGSVGDWTQVVTTALRAFGIVDPTGPIATVRQADVRQSGIEHPGKYAVVTDPPYFAAIGYADLSEYFYYWIRIALREICPDLFATVGVPKLSELIASPARHGGRAAAAQYFINGFTDAFSHLADIAHEEFPIVVVYAQRQEEQPGESGATTGWEAMLEAILQAGLGITGTWPIRGARSARMRALGSNSLASYIVLVCRTRRAELPTGSRREFLSALRKELPPAMLDLQQASIAPVDLAQAAIGPGMGVFTRFARVLEADGKALSVRDALSLINQTLDEALVEQEGDFDADTRWAVAWFEQSGFEEGEYGVAETLSKAKNTSVAGMVDAGLLSSKAGRVRLFRPDELPADWDPGTDPRLTAWEVVHQLVRALEAGGETAVAALVAKLGSKAEGARELAYRLYALCERKKRAPQALSYNALVQSWPEIIRLTQDLGKVPEQQVDLFGQER